MKYDPDRHHRRSIRLKHYDYSLPGAYFITICTEGRVHLFGEIADDEMKMNELGEIVHRAWHNLPVHYPQVELDTFVVMPNHVHGIIVLIDDIFVEQPPGYRRHSLPEIVRGFKSYSARRINLIRRTNGVTVWQRDYYEHIVRNEDEMHGIRDYIATNPLRWPTDQDNIHRVP